MLVALLVGTKHTQWCDTFDVFINLQELTFSNNQHLGSEKKDLIKKIK